MRTAFILCAVLVSACSGTRPGETRAEARVRRDCGETIEDRAEFATVARALADARTPTMNLLAEVYGERVFAGGRYAIIDDEGYVGTVRAIEPQKSHLAVVHACRDTASWWATWVDPPARTSGHDNMWAFGPIDGRFSSARRLLPQAAPADSFGIVRTAPPPWPKAEHWVTQFQFAFDSAPGGFEMRARRCAPGLVVTETRIREGDAYRVVSRTHRAACEGDRGE